MSNMVENRARGGVIVSAAGIVLNICLAAAKLTVGIFCGLVSVVADGFNNLSDCGSSIVSLASFKIAEKPADKEHPYGHRRAEYVASMVIGFLILFVGAELLRESLNKIMEGALFNGTPVVFIVLGISVAVKCAMFVFYRVAAKKLQSDTLRAASADSLGDCLATLAVIVGALLSRYAKLPADGWTGLLVALFIGWQGVAVLREAGSKLLGQAPDQKLVNDIRAIVLSDERVLGLHDLRVYMYGRDTYFATVHMELDAAMPALQSHEILDRTEREVRQKLGVTLTAHLDPVDLKDDAALKLEAEVRKAAEGIVQGLELHDFRLVRGDVPQLIFDAGIPFACPLSDEEVKKRVEDVVISLCRYEPIVTVERE